MRRMEGLYEAYGGPVSGVVKLPPDMPRASNPPFERANPHRHHLPLLPPSVLRSKASHIACMPLRIWIVFKTFYIVCLPRPGIYGDEVAMGRGGRGTEGGRGERQPVAAKWRGVGACQCQGRDHDSLRLGDGS